MEFFLQTLVKRGYASQAWLLAMQQLLMLLSTAAALQVGTACNVGEERRGYSAQRFGDLLTLFAEILRNREPNDRTQVWGWLVPS